MTELLIMTRIHMKSMYDKAGGPWAWSDESKLAELRHDSARYLLVSDNLKRVAAFVHFRFEIENDIAVAYVYELQVLPDFRSQGLGLYLMNSVELFCLRETEIETIVLTVFKHNQPALSFYEKLGYTTHPTSPPSECYTILTKDLA